MIRFGRRPIDGGRLDEILDKNYDYNRYFRIGHVNSNIFVQWFRTSSSAFSSALFRETFAITEPLLFFDQKSNFGTRTMSKLAKDENPEIKSFRIALVRVTLR